MPTSEMLEEGLLKSTEIDGYEREEWPACNASPQVEEWLAPQYYFIETRYQLSPVAGLSVSHPIISSIATVVCLPDHGFVSYSWKPEMKLVK